MKLIPVTLVLALAALPLSCSGNTGVKDTDPFMQADSLQLSAESIRMGKDFTIDSIRIASSRDWSVEYNRDLLKLEPESGPGQVDSQTVIISLREGVDWERDIMWDCINGTGGVDDAVFSAGSKSCSVEFVQDIPSMMMLDWIGFNTTAVKIPKEFRSTGIKVFCSRDWSVEYDRDLLKLEPESGPGQVDSQVVNISLREGVDWERDILNGAGNIPDAVFTCGKKTKKLLFSTVIPDYPRPKDGDVLKIIEFNIERGMAADKGNNFDNFVAWVKAQDPDVLLMCECNELNDATMQRLASRWGHPYAAVCVDDGWNPAITSKYPMENLVKYTKGFSHGALSARILGINFICMHACATWYSDGDWYGGEAKDYDGNGTINSFDYRIAELHCLFDNTIFKYPEEKYWVLTGDLNAVSPTEKRWENWYSGYYVEHNYILSLNFWTDIMRVQHPDEPMFTYSRYHDWDDAKMAATESNPAQMSYERLDYFYISGDLVPRVEDSNTTHDDFTDRNSDHRPIYMNLIYKQ